MTTVDIEAINRLAEKVVTLGELQHFIGVVGNAWPALYRELVKARKVVEKGRKVDITGGGTLALMRAIVEYDQAIAKDEDKTPATVTLECKNETGGAA